MINLANHPSWRLEGQLSTGELAIIRSGCRRWCCRCFDGFKLLEQYGLPVPYWRLISRAGRIVMSGGHRNE